MEEDALQPALAKIKKAKAIAFGMNTPQAVKLAQLLTDAANLLKSIGKEHKKTKTERENKKLNIVYLSLK